MMAHTTGDKKAALRDQHRPYDLSVDHQDISERISTLMQEIRDIQEMNARGLNIQTQTERAAYAEHEIRLFQIRE